MKQSGTEEQQRNQQLKHSSKERNRQRSDSRRFSQDKTNDLSTGRGSDGVVNDKSINSQSMSSKKIKTNITKLFNNNELMNGCVPIFLSKPTQQIFNIITDEQITKESPFKLISKTDILNDLQMRAAVSDFSTKKSEIKSYPGTDILIIYDADLKFGENFILVLSEETKNQLLQSKNSDHQTNMKNKKNEQEIDLEEFDKELNDENGNLDNMKRSKSKKKTHTDDDDDDDDDDYGNEDDDENDDEKRGEDDNEDQLEEESDSVAHFYPRPNHSWISLGSEKEIIESNLLETRSKIYTIFQKPRRDFGSIIQFQDSNATEKLSNHLILSTNEKNLEIPILEMDKSVTNSELTHDHGTNTDWKYPRNAFTQYTPRIFNLDEIQYYLNTNGIMLNNLYKLFEQNLLENIMYNFLSNDYELLAKGDETYDTRTDNTFKEFLSFTDLKFTKDKSITQIQWHPTIKGLLATSVGERLIYDQKIEQYSRILLTSTHIILWSIFDPLQPQLLLEAPEDILCFQFNPTNSNIIAGGCVNGLVVLWDMEKYITDLNNIKLKIKNKNKSSLFTFDDNDVNKVPILPYCCLSNIETSHSLPIMDLQWIPDHFEISRLGYCIENLQLKCVQLITCGLNHEILIWDIRSDKSPLAIDKIRDSIQPAMNVPNTFSALDMKWKPLLRVHLFKTDPGGDHAPTKFCIKEVQGDRRVLAANVEDKNATSGTGGKATSKARPLQGINTHFYVGTEDGDLVYVDWMPQKDQDTGKMQTPKPEFYAPRHDGPISYLARSPFEPNVLLVVGGWTWTLWKEGVHSGPIIESGHAVKPLTGGSWSPSRPSVFYITRADGSLEVWDILDKTHEPAMVQSISANALTAISLWTFSKRQIIAIGDTQGALQLFVVPRRLKSILPSELVNFNAYIEREVKRREFVIMRWNLREQERIEQEAENKRKAGVAPAVTLTADELLQKEKAEYEQYLSEEHAFLRSLGLIEDDDLE